MRYANDETIGEKRKRALQRLLRKMQKQGGPLLAPSYSLVEVLEKRKLENIEREKARAYQDNKASAQECGEDDIGLSHHASRSE